jgi:hypothetical protein
LSTNCQNPQGSKAPSVEAIPGPTPDIDNLTLTSDLIVLGELVTVEQGIGDTTADVNGSPAKARIDRATLRIDELVGGTQQSPLVFEIIIPDQYVGGIIPPQQSYGLFFFRLGDNGKLTFTDRYYSYVRVPRGLYSQGDMPLDRVVSILSEMLLLPNSRDLNVEALFYLQYSKSKSANGALRTALNTAADFELQIGIANGLLRQGDASSLGFIKRLFLTGPVTSVDNSQEEALGNVMAYYLQDPEAIADLEELLGASSVYIRRGAAGALRRTKSPKAVNGLTRALEDTDLEVRYWGVAGLAEITGQNEWRPSEERFKTQESEFLQHWKEWARNR